MRNTSADDIILRTHAISMLFPGTIALDSVDYQVWRGKVNVIIGVKVAYMTRHRTI